jgi:glyoxylase-like metal-dependent hydrolase (beta-lactamase superfamily II)
MLKALKRAFKILSEKRDAEVHTRKLEENLFLIDLMTGGFKNLIASYVLKGKKVMIVETGPTSSIPNLLSGLKELNVKFEDVKYVAISHVHIDHGGGVGTLLKHLPNAKVIVHQQGAPHLINPEKLWLQSKKILRAVAEIYGEPEPVPENRIIAATDGITFDVGNNVRLKVVETLGHASHHFSYHEPSSQGIFPGDAAGIYLPEFDVTIPTTPPPFRLDIALASLDKLISLKPKASYYSHFGKASDAIKHLRAYVQQIKLWAKIAKLGVKNKQSLDAIRMTILEADETIRDVVLHLKEHLIFRETVLGNSVQGFIDFAEKSEI